MADEEKKSVKDNKGDVTLKNGKSYSFDLDSFTYGEWREAIDGGDIDKLLLKVLGMKVEELNKLTLGDKKRLQEAFINKVTSPLASPN